MHILNCERVSSRESSNGVVTNGVSKHSLILISSLVVSIATIFAINLKTGQNESTEILSTDHVSDVQTSDVHQANIQTEAKSKAQVLTHVKAQAITSEVEDFHSNEYVPLESVNHLKHQQHAVSNVAEVEAINDEIDEAEKNNQLIFLDNVEKDDSEVSTALTKTKRSTLATSVIKISNFPVKDGSLSSGFGMRKHPIHGNMRMHSGIDIAAQAGTKVQAMGEGTVVFAGRKAGYGNNIEIKHGNTVLTRYSHLKEILVEVGQKVTPADVIGLVGSTGVSTGPHLHLEVALNETEVDPRIFLAGKATVASKPIIRQYAKASDDSKLVANFDEATYQDYLQSFDGLYGLVVPGQTN
ncbi:M23 family metallopeptidase [uncultured Cocleimonas sp.]|uniref:M23 family metallopeptidase n=1 Tax=uncultured Cocleimonas sp. TaxID=1051587 RepID=UPI002615FEF1|nr:M23 family metallopeptidase [uncultured Cocleimonas sp.]